jgi:ribosomal protein L17
MYKPVRATQEMRGHSYAELCFARNLEGSVQEFAQIIKGEKEGRNAREFIEQMIKEAEELKNESKRN